MKRTALFVLLSLVLGSGRPAGAALDTRTESFYRASVFFAAAFTFAEFGVYAIWAGRNSNLGSEVSTDRQKATANTIYGISIGSAVTNGLATLTSVSLAYTCVNDAKFRRMHQERQAAFSIFKEVFLLGDLVVLMGLQTWCNVEVTNLKNLLGNQTTPTFSAITQDAAIALTVISGVVTASAIGIVAAGQILSKPKSIPAG